MSWQLDVLMLLSVVLLSVRVSALLLFSPIFNTFKLPPRVQIFFALILSYVLVVNVGVSAASVPDGVLELATMVVYELFLGALLAFGVIAAFAAFMFGGRILDFQMGFGVASLIDPATSQQAPVVGTALNLMAVMAFFMIDGHHMILRGLAYSLETVPPGVALSQLNLPAVVQQFGFMFVYGFAVVAPAVLAVLLVDVGMAVAARTMPQVNMFIVGIPLKIFVGLVVLAISINYMAPLLEKVFKSIFVFWQKVIV